jgi:hypothetical protein
VNYFEAVVGHGFVHAAIVLERVMGISQKIVSVDCLTLQLPSIKNIYLLKIPVSESMSHMLAFNPNYLSKTHLGIFLAAVTT